MKEQWHELKVIMYAKNVFQKELADELGISQATMNSKLNGKTAFLQPEVVKIKEVLEITDEEAVKIFLK